MGKCVVHPLGADKDLAAQVGDIKLSAMDLEAESGGEWLACDGRMVRAEDYPTLAPILLPSYAGNMDILPGTLKGRKHQFAFMSDGRIVNVQGAVRSSQTTILQSKDAAWSEARISTNSSGGSMVPSAIYSDGNWIIGTYGSYFSATKNPENWPRAIDGYSISGAVIQGDIAYTVVQNNVYRMDLPSRQMTHVLGIGSGKEPSKAFLHNGGRYLWVQSNSVTHISDDGISWTPINYPGGIIAGVVRSGYFFLFRTDGSVMYSESGESFSEFRPSAVSTYYYDIYHLGGHWILVGNRGAIMVSVEDRLEGVWLDCTPEHPEGTTLPDNQLCIEENGQFFILGHGAPQYCAVGDKALPRSKEKWPSAYIKVK